ncbi:hypothetical protein OOK12_43955 [Streptomyces sp. NBC_00452]|uniref:hypothetical protein n=1 Tax=Streptomyces sp. NBC_00452 TaxID=2975746 RepID=UPI0022574FD1|nr:hypothetical protein [Streptomyces sp. NBC_00452]MCX5063814.1 hypothetical protein [Streptomyces sp. NBC_00452]
MTPHHAVEITLTRPATRGELRYARCGVLLAANADRTRLMAVHGARSPSGALHALRRRLDALLPIDVLNTHYPNRHGQILLNVALGHTADRALRRDAAVVGQQPQDVLRQRVTAALTQEKQERARRLEDRLESLLAHHTPDEVLACVAVLLYGRQHHPACAAP